MGFGKYLLGAVGIAGAVVTAPVISVIALGAVVSAAEKDDILFKDVEIAGKEQGYKKAANEYEKAFREIESEYKVTKELIESQKNLYDEKSDILIEKLSALEKMEAELERQVERKTKDVSIKYNIPNSSVCQFSTSGTMESATSLVGILGLINSHKEKKLMEAEQRGYIEAKELYDEKIERLKKDLYELKKKGSVDIQKLLDMISDLFDDIADEQMKIADLKILL